MAAEYARDTGRHVPFDVAVPVKYVAQLLEFAGWTDLSTDAVLKLMEDQEFRERILEQMCNLIEDEAAAGDDPERVVDGLEDTMVRLGMGPSPAGDSDLEPSDSDLDDDSDLDPEDDDDEDDSDLADYGGTRYPDE